MSEADDTPETEEPTAAAQLRQTGSGLVRYVEDNPLAAIAGAIIVGVLLARLAFLGNPKK
jgi:hypothetical protein